MAYVDSSGKTHVSLSEAKSGHAAKTTASRDAAGTAVGNSQGSNYSRQQEAQKAQEIQRAQAIQAAQQQTPVFSQAYQQQNQRLQGSMAYQQQNARLQEQIKAVKPNTSGSFTIDTSEETVRRAKAQGLDVSLDRLSGKIIINAATGEATKGTLEAIHNQIHAEESERWKGALSYTIQGPKESLVSKVATRLGVKPRLDAANKKASGYIPSLEQFQEKRDTHLEKIGLLDKRREITQKIQSNEITAGIQNYYVDGYKILKNTPVEWAAGAAVIYGAGAAAGAAVKTTKLVTRPIGNLAAKKTAEGTIRVISRSNNKLVTAGVGRVGTAAANAFEKGSIIDYGLGGLLVHDYATTVTDAYKIGGGRKAVQSTMKFGTDLAIGAPGFKKGMEKTERLAAGDLTAVLPLVKNAKITELVGTGAETTPVDLIYGKSVVIGNTPLLTYVKGRGFARGVVGAPEATLKGKTTQSFSKLENKFFQKTVESTSTSPADKDYLQHSLNIVKKVNDSSKPLTTPETFEITSKSVPETMRPAVKEGIVSYKGHLYITGSVPMKAQADPFVSRTPQDLEIYGDSKSKISAHIVKTLESKGFVEGKDFKADIKTGKIDFQVPNNKGKLNWDNGIEIFTHGTTETNTGKAITDALSQKNTMEKLNTVISSDGSPSPTVQAWKSEIAFGYDSAKAVKIEHGAVKIQSLKEQMSRKIAGSTIYHDLALKPAHPGRMKDPLDVITMGTAYAVKGKVPIEKDVVGFTEAAYQKWGGSTSNDPYSIAFRSKVATDPVVDFIHTNKRLPTEAELFDIGAKLPEVPIDSRVLYSTMEPVKTGNPLVDSIVSDKGRHHSKTVDPIGFSPSPSIKPVNPIGFSPSPSIKPINPIGFSPSPSIKPINPIGFSPSPSIKPINPVSFSPSPSIKPVNPVSFSPSPSIKSPDPWSKSPDPWIPDPFDYRPPPPKPINFDFSLDFDPSKHTKKIKETKNKMRKNEYGDPFKIKLKI